MDLKQIKQIIELMKRAELSEFAVEEEGFKLKIRRGAAGVPAAPSAPGTTAPFVIATDTTIPAAAPASTGPGSAASATDGDEAGVAYIKSPMVGTFYRAPSPDSAVFADVGTKVTESSVVCIVEAMKIMNEIQAEVKGTILDVLVENGEPVEYGQRLFKVRSN